MNEEMYQAMIRGLKATIIEREVVFGEVDAKKSVLCILNLMEDLDQFWNNDDDLDPNAEALHAFTEATRKKYNEVKDHG